MIPTIKRRPASPGTHSIAPGTLHLDSARRRQVPNAPGGRGRPLPLKVMKFGGTSVGDAGCVRKVVEIVSDALRSAEIVVVVSAMSGVTNRLIDAAARAEGGDFDGPAACFAGLLVQHQLALSSLLPVSRRRNVLRTKLRDICEEGLRLCRATAETRELTLPVRDAVSSLGERLSSLLLAGALAEAGITSQAVDAVDLISTDSHYGAAEPRMDRTRSQSQSRLLPLLNQGVTPVVTGFIGATEAGTRTTLGRGGSDYSATILAAALDADEVIIWTDVTGVMTVDPRHVPGAATIPELSYREASELAYFGAKVLHPKTLHPVTQSGIPLWIRNTFRPDDSGTKVTARPPAAPGAVKALSAIGDVTRITVDGVALAAVRDLLARVFSATAAVRAEVLLISYSSSQQGVSFVVPTAAADRTVDALHAEFSHELTDSLSAITRDREIALVAVVGERMSEVPGVLRRTLAALHAADVNVLAVAPGSSGCNLSLMIFRADMSIALEAAHREFKLELSGAPGSRRGAAGRAIPASPKRTYLPAKIASPFKKSKRKLQLA